ncbi:uncharacterized protein LOC106650658 [Trichogramma pretiosum]|uniref:uncharacterized protein LOC106650658 n=1 Tax=Trichogramma pretiosum TaxID=7493 RepID=UPI0006C9BE72|nr:uncharacterized protein LOC106650658 [Trichogramma pretiosum]XP_014224285.1 uncharacterized protein LOC106650658 [Trichogramma pretiosum]
MSNEVAEPVETSLNSSPPVPKSTRRRSTAFQRQSIGPISADCDTTQDVTHESKKFKSSERAASKSSFDLKGYIARLESEDAQWREEYARRRIRTRNTSLLLKTIEAGQKLDLSVLTSREKAFLDARPNYDEFNENLHRLSELATKVTYLNLNASHLCEKSVTNLKSEVEKAKQRIIQFAD